MSDTDFEIDKKELREMLESGDIPSEGNIYGFEPSDDELSIIQPPLRPLAFPTDKLCQDPANARYHPEKNKRMVERSIKAYGMRSAVIARVDNLVLEAGNLRQQIFAENGWKWIPAILVDDDSMEAAAFGLAHNRTAELGQWDADAAIPKLEMVDTEWSGGDIEDTGFTKFDFEKMEENWQEEEQWGADLDEEEDFGEEDKMFARITVKCPPEHRTEIKQRIEGFLADIEGLEVE